MSAASSFEHLEEVFKAYLGKKGQLGDILKGLKDLSPEEKQVIGPLANKAKIAMTEAFEKKKNALAREEVEERIKNEWLDITLPGLKQADFSGPGAVNPFSEFSRRAVEIFKKLGFTIWDGGHVVHDYENFEFLNFPQDHPARDMQDTFFLDDGYLLRTQTSTVQGPILKKQDFPIRAVVPGRCFRNEATDATHEVIFTQLEGVVVDENISVSHLIAMLKHFLKEVFGPQVKTRIRPGYFPFVEPGLELEVDSNTLFGKSEGQEPKWMEVMPCGMIHPHVLKEAGIDHKKYSGFAFGFGLSRLTMLHYGIEDCRLMFAEDAKYLKQFIA